MIVGVALLLAMPVQHMHMPGMTMPGPAPTKRAAVPKRSERKAAAPKRRARPVQAPDRPAAACSPDHAAMGHCTAPDPMPPMQMPALSQDAPAATCSPEHAAMGHCAMPPETAPVGTDQAAGNAPPPAPPMTRAADAFYDPVAMAAADRGMRREHGGMRFSQVILNIAEMQVRDGWRWDGEGWFGGDIHRLVLKTEGEGDVGRRPAGAEVQALYARAIDPYWNVQAGVRQDLGRGAKRTYATVGVEGLAPYWFDVEAALFLSDRGDVLGRVEAWYDQRITQRLIAQPRAEVNVAAQDMPGSGIGSGLSNAEVGLRLRYELRREFAPYVGVSWERRYGDTARFARAKGDGTGGVAFVAGVRAWF